MIVSNVVWSPPAPQLALERGTGTGGVLNGCLSGKIPTQTRRLRRRLRRGGEGDDKGGGGDEGGGEGGVARWWR